MPTDEPTPATTAAPANHQAAATGYRMPAEWEPLDAVWVCTPHNPTTWPGCLEQARTQFSQFVSALESVVEVRTTESAGIATDDSWIRDYGPLFVTDAEGKLAVHDFRFNCWGNKYDDYKQDDLVDKRIAYLLGLKLFTHDFVLEGGAVDVNGRGTVMTTRQSLLSPADPAHTRNPITTQQQIEATLHAALGTTHIIWLDGGIEGDDTDGHIDDVARFIAPDRIVAVRPQPNADISAADADVLERNWKILLNAQDQGGSKIDLVQLPVPHPLYFDYPPDDYSPGGRRRLPASYANFLIANNTIFVPTFGSCTDDLALQTIDTAAPSYNVVPVRCDRLVVGLGALHCLSMQQPRPTTTRDDVR